MPRLAPTFFIGIVPPAILAIDIHKLIVASQSGVLRWIDAQTMKSIGFVAILINWGFAFWWFVLSLIIVAHYQKYPVTLCTVLVGLYIPIGGTFYRLWSCSKGDGL